MNSGAIVVLVIGLLLNIAAFFLPFRWLIRLFVIAVIASAYMPVALSLFGFNLRFSQTLIPILLVRLASSGVLKKRSPFGNKLFLAGSLFWVSLLGWTIVHAGESGNLAQPFGHVILMGMNLVHALIAYLLVVSEDELRKAAIVLLASVAVFNGLLLLANTDAVRNHVDTSFLTQDEGAVVLQSGAMGGSNISRFVVGVATGNISAAALVLVMSLLWTGRESRGLLGAVAIMCIVGIVVGFSRQALVGLAAGTSLMMVYLMKARNLKRVIGLVAVAVFFVGVFFATAQISITESYWEAFAGRAMLLRDPNSYGDGTVNDRLRMWSMMADDIRENPLAGSGQDAYLVYFPYAGGSGSHNYPLEVLHATGILGFLPFLYLHAAAMWESWRMAGNRRIERAARLRMLGLLLAFCVLVLSSLTNLIAWNPAYWLLFGIVAGSARLLKQRSLLRPLWRPRPRPTTQLATHENRLRHVIRESV
jgi:O-antigen ligase